MTYRTVFGRGFSLGAISSTRQVELLDTMYPLYNTLSEIRVLLNQAADANIGAGQMNAWMDEHDALTASAGRLSDRVADLETPEDVAEWNAELERIETGVGNLGAQVRAGLRSLISTSRFSVGLWTGAIVLGAVGGVLALRLYANKRKRRRRRRRR